MILSTDLRAAVLRELDARRLLGITLDVRAPQYVHVFVEAQLRLPEPSDPGLIAQTRQRAEEALYRYLNPYIGGPQGTGWPFGRDLLKSEIYGLLQQVPPVEFVESLRVFESDPKGGRTEVTTRLSVAHHALICSDTHTVTGSPSS